MISKKQLKELLNLKGEAYNHEVKKLLDDLMAKNRAKEEQARLLKEAQRNDEIFDMALKGVDIVFSECATKYNFEALTEPFQWENSLGHARQYTLEFDFAIDDSNNIHPRSLLLSKIDEREPDGCAISAIMSEFFCGDIAQTPIDKTLKKLEHPLANLVKLGLVNRTLKNDNREGVKE